MTAYSVKCTCGNVAIKMNGEPKVRGYCHCEDCRDLLAIPYHSVDAWEKDKVQIIDGADQITEYQHPRLTMMKYMCKKCGDVLFNSNAMDWRVFSQISIARSYDGKLPEELKSESHFFYARRIVEVSDDLRKID